VNRGVGGITKGADVRQSYSDPFYWAPFILIGNYE
jgi:CHAT domain-containing protein